MFKKVFFLILILSFLPILVFAFSLNINISLNQQKYSPGDNIDARIMFTNNSEKEIKGGKLICDFISYNKKFPPLPQIKEINLKLGESQEMHCQMLVNKFMPSGLWRIAVEARDNYDNLIAKSYKNFFITNTKKQINADLLICADKNCQTSKVVFLKGETIYLKLKTNINDLQIQSGLYDAQNQKLQDIIFTNNKAQIKAKKEGSFLIILQLHKKGYNEQIIQKDFAVIAEQPKIKSDSICNVDGKCSGNENSQNCPQDCLQKFKIKRINQIKVVILIIAIITVIGITFFVYWFFIKRRNKINNF